jgi:uncharacterized membrane protein YiaA
MKNSTLGRLNYKVTSDLFDVKFGQGACFLAGLLVFVLSFWKMTRLELTESQLFFGVLLSFATPLLFIIMGLLLPIVRSIQKA